MSGENVTGRVMVGWGNWRSGYDSDKHFSLWADRLYCGGDRPAIKNDTKPPRSPQGVPPLTSAVNCVPLGSWRALCWRHGDCSVRSDVDGNARRSSLIAKVALIITTVMADWMLKNRLSVYPLLKERVIYRSFFERTSYLFVLIWKDGLSIYP